MNDVLTISPQSFELMGDEAEFALLSPTSFMTITCVDNPLTLKVYTIDPGSTHPVLRASFQLPFHPSDIFRHWVFLSVYRDGNRAPFRPDVTKGIITLEVAPVQMVENTYTLVFHNRTLMNLSGLYPLSPNQSTESLPLVEPRIYAWKEWGPTNTRLFEWSPSGCTVGWVFGSQLARTIQTTDGGYRLAVLDFNPATAKWQAEHYSEVQPTELSSMELLPSSTSSGSIKGETDIGPDITGLIPERITTSLPFTFNISSQEFESPYVQLDYEHVLVTEVRVCTAGTATFLI